MTKRGFLPVAGMLFLTALLLSGCASQNLTAPCPNFGAHCGKLPINSWNYTTA